jgi:hypothetical protein
VSRRAHEESVQFADAVAATLALVAVAGVLAARRGQPWVAGPVPVGVAAVTTVALVVPAMVAAGSHPHAARASARDVAEAAALVAETVRTLPRFADVPTIEAMGYRTIADGDTSFEHFVNWDLVADGRVLDPDHPESLVFAVDPATRARTLSAAMFMANPGDTLDTVPGLGGALLQWHIHDDLCFEGEPRAWRVADVTEPGTACRPGTVRLSLSTVPMVHVWIIPHRCGPFAALDGDGAGQIKPGEKRRCDGAHGHHG